MHKEKTKQCVFPMILWYFFLEENDDKLPYHNCWKCKIFLQLWTETVLQTFKQVWEARLGTKTTKSRIKATYYFGGNGHLEDRNDARRPDWWWGKSNCGEDLPRGANVGERKLLVGWLEGVGARFGGWETTSGGTYAKGCSRWCRGCVENRK